MNDHIERTKRMIEVMQAYVDGEEIEVNRGDGFWLPYSGHFPFNSAHHYRIAKTPDSINWDHVAPEFKYMARDQDGYSYLYNGYPSPTGGIWCTFECLRPLSTFAFSSYKRGTVDWKDSLVIRPGAE